MNKRIAILGSTGSIGCSALEVIEHLGPPYRVAALSGHTQTEKLLEQARKYRPTAIALSISPPTVASEFSKLGIKIYQGATGLIDLICRDDIDLVLAAIVGAAGLPAVLAAVEAKKTIALANKESLVVAGSLLIPLAKKNNVQLLPVDSEHSAVFQAAQSGRLEEIKRIILTASGGPFRRASANEIENATLQDALNHPTWRMGSKITIDSATMFNKALEIIEACWLFGLAPDKVEVVIHPESIVHSMVEFIDGSVIAQLSPPDMRTPIQYALTYPKRLPGISRTLDLSKPFSLNFEKPDPDRFPALRLGYQVARKGGTFGAVLNAANEAAVAAFTSGKIRFVEICKLVAATIDAHQLQESPSLDDLLQADTWARDTVNTLIDNPARQASGHVKESGKS
ncbi:MAG TPA: 1-deoxy-D-xylulose-5-phosphate reductoisomerase [Tepidisphaeraceae bacterium]|nr:1-deoxy-D-xylulose-5-phosphate reductoisomerase [Tepidisphaeraceae bacterium]